MLSIGARFDRYTIEALLGQGGMGEVYRAYDPRLERRVALKVLGDGGAAGSRDSTGNEARLLREARAAAALDHPNVVSIFDVGVVDGVTFLAMELIDGQTLRSFVGGDAPLATRLAWLADIAATLAFAHRRGLVHRDIKPENIMVRGDGALKVLDFGIARRAMATPTAATLRADEIAASHAIDGVSGFAGTPHYMAPEQMLGEPLDGRSDQFAWGVVAYELLTGGSMPWSGALDLLALAAAVSSRDATQMPLVPGLSDHVREVIMRALRRAPDERFESMDDLLAALGDVGRRPSPVPAARAAATQPTRGSSDAFAATLIGRAPPSAARRRPRRARLLAGGLALLTAVGALALALTRLRGEAPTLAPAAEAARRAVAVIGFKNLSGREEADWLGTALVETMTSELALGEQLRTVSVDEIERMKRELRLGAAERIDREQLDRVGRRLGAQLVVTGAYLAIGGKLRLDVRLIDLETGEPVATVSESDQEAELIALVARTGSALRHSLRAGELRADQAEVLRASLPGTPEAMRLYATGLASLRAFDGPRAREALERLTEIEPAFPLGHAALADAYSALGMREKAVVASQRAMELSRSLRREEQMRIEARYHEATASWERAIEIARALHELYPDNLDHGLLLVSIEIGAGRMKEAIAAISAMRRLPPPLGDDARLDLAEATAGSRIGDNAAVERAAGRALTRAEAIGASTIAVRARLLLAWTRMELGEVSAARDEFERLRRQAAEIGDPLLLVEVLNGLIVASFQAGDLATGIGYAEEALQTVQVLGDRLLAGDLRLNKVSMYVRHCRLDAATRELEAVAEVSPENQSTVRIIAGKIAALRGDVRAARVILEEELRTHRALDGERVIAWVQEILASAALDEGSVAEAEALARESIETRERLGLAAFAAESRVVLAQIALSRGRYAEAADLARAAAEVFAAAGSIDQEAEAWAWLATASNGAGRADEALTALTRARVLVADREAPGPRLRTRLAAAAVDVVRGDRAEAARGLAEVVAEATRLGLRPVALEARTAAANVDIREGRAAEGQAALAVVAREAEELGLGRLAREARRK